MPESERKLILYMILFSDVLEVLKDLDETSKRNVDILQHFLVGDISCVF